MAKGLTYETHSTDKHEYVKVIGTDLGDFKHLVKTIEKMEDDGWSLVVPIGLVSGQYTSGGHLCGGAFVHITALLFRRPKQPK